MGIVVKNVTINEEDSSFCIHWQFIGTVFRWFDVVRVWKWIPDTKDNLLDKNREYVFLAN